MAYTLCPLLELIRDGKKKVARVWWKTPHTMHGQMIKLQLFVIH